MHGIQIEAFKTSNGMQLLQKEIEQWNSIKLTREPMWLTKHDYHIFAKHSNLLHNEQIGGRKNRSAIDASLCLLHDIQTAKNSKNVFSCLFLDVKGAFNHVSTERLIAILQK